MLLDPSSLRWVTMADLLPAPEQSLEEGQPELMPDA